MIKAEPVRLLLSKVAIHYGYQRRGPNFNIFSTLKSISDEVGLHSKFIYAVLSFKSRDFDTGKIRRKFLEIIGLDFD